MISGRTPETLWEIPRPEFLVLAGSQLKPHSSKLMAHSSRLIAHNSALQKAYDAVAYPNWAHRRTHPRHLEAFATLLGMEPPPVPTCRVLELGCARGGNLIPQAEDLPQATFLGIDLSPRQIEQGQATINALGLRNIELRQGDILAIDDALGQFDYILCHGVFSWVPREVQEKILEVCRRNLASNGVALVSYNTYPGWRPIEAVRDVLRYQAAKFSDPRQQIEQAQAMLQFLASPGD